ncbi:hypothetical protein H2201_004229 [Coniosporium apollinis]|uniref:Uncharacterized protein n=1 Tax=Coniosporium apollinis TaxID=61459 RepID=A0ABQ9NUE4_9PEZI|nr:hypothetical protein H2201_004229 [Coniosporium apollinis]
MAEEDSGVPVVRPSAILLPAMKVGAFSGAFGIVLGGATGIVRSTAPGLFAAAAGIQWFLMGSVFWAARDAQLHANGIRNWWLVRQNGKPSPLGIDAKTTQDRIRASAVAGAVTGGIAGASRGRANVVPGIIMFGIFGFAGQKLYNLVDAKRIEEEEAKMSPGYKKDNFWKRVANSKWSPMKVLSDEEYEAMLQEKLLSVEAEIAIMDENIKKLREAAAEGSGPK